MHPETESPATSIATTMKPHAQPPLLCVESSGWRPIGRQSIFMRSNELCHRSPRDFFYPAWQERFREFEATSVLG